MLSTATKRTTQLLSHISKPPFKKPYTTATMTDTSKYKFNHTMLRVRDPTASVSTLTLITSFETSGGDYNNS